MKAWHELYPHVLAIVASQDRTLGDLAQKFSGMVSMQIELDRSLQPGTSEHYNSLRVLAEEGMPPEILARMRVGVVEQLKASGRPFDLGFCEDAFDDPSSRH